MFRIGINCYPHDDCLCNWYIWSYTSIILLWVFWVRRISLEVCFVTLHYVSIVFNFVETIAFLAFRPMNTTCESSMFLFPAIFILEDIRIYIGISDYSNVLTNVKIPVD